MDVREDEVTAQHAIPSIQRLGDLVVVAVRRDELIVSELQLAQNLNTLDEPKGFLGS